jgi:hypothetical protein
VVYLSIICYLVNFLYHLLVQNIYVQGRLCQNFEYFINLYDFNVFGSLHVLRKTGVLHWGHVHLDTHCSPRSTSSSSSSDPNLSKGECTYGWYSASGGRMQGFQGKVKEHQGPSICFGDQ